MTEDIHSAVSLARHDGAASPSVATAADAPSPASAAQLSDTSALGLPDPDVKLAAGVR